LRNTVQQSCTAGFNPGGGETVEIRSIMTAGQRRFQEFHKEMGRQ